MKLFNNYAVVAAATIVALCAVVTVAQDASAAENVEETTSMTTEEPVKRVHVLNPGEREYLSPNLIGVQNIAMTFLPLSLNFINVIEAYREIMNGVRYEILLNAQETKDEPKDEPKDSQELVCRLVILEKPWIRTEWGDKWRELQFSNCTRDMAGDNEEDNRTNGDAARRSKLLNDKSTANAFYNGGTRNELSDNEMSKLESQIIPLGTTPALVTDDAADEMTTTEFPAPLNDNQQKWLDDFLSPGTQQQALDQEQESQQEAEMVLEPEPEQNGNVRTKREVLTGGASNLDSEVAKERMEKVFAKLAAGYGPKYTIVKVHKATTQVVSGTLTKIHADIKNGNNEQETCDIVIWSQPWLSNGDEVTVDCPNKEVLKQRLSRSTEHLEKKTFKKHHHHNLDKTEHLFNKFQAKYKRRYASTMERQMRLRIFKQNIKIIEELNRNEMGSAKYGLTEFADMTSVEYKQRTGLWQREPQRAMRNKIADVPDIEIPKEFDWREKGVVSKVKNQGNCGSCWAFSVTGNIEGLHAVKTGILEEYSEQELLDCDTIDSACNGGLPDNAYEAVEKIGGLELESEYPYKGRKDQCHFNKTMSHIRVSGHVDLPKNETKMVQWLMANGPISIGINANAMQFYRGGVSHPWRPLCSHSNLDHGVLIVGFGVSDYPMFKKTLPYWIVKNSWGPKWGEQGYYRVYRGDNTCGVSEMATSAVLAN